jgi:SAM-dependent methyltransferase
MRAVDADLFDQRRYPTASAVEGYGEWAETYEATVAAGLDGPILERVASIEFEKIYEAADLACGTGRTGEWLRTKGVEAIDGVDITPEMLAIAERKNIYRRLAVAEVSATPLPGARYGLVTMSLADEHLAELGPAYREANRLLVAGGSFLLVGYHPFFLMNGLLTHFHRRGGEAVTIRSYVHLFSEHYAAGRAAGLLLEELRECLIDEEWLRTKPKWRKYLNWPVSFAMVWRRSET